MAAPIASACRLTCSGILAVNLGRRFFTRFSSPLSQQSGATSADNGDRAEQQTPERSTFTHSNQRERTHDSAEEEEYDMKHRIFIASLQFVPQYGWSKKTLAAGAEAAGLPPLAHGMFLRGEAELISFFYQDCNHSMAQMLKTEVEDLAAKDEKPHTKQFVRNAVETRLRMISPYIDKWPQAMAIQTLPQNAVESWTNLSELVDDIWYYAGDRSIDFNWYSKRLSLAAVYKSTEISMVQDRSADFDNTWHFLDRRLENLATFGKTVRNFQQGSESMGKCAQGIWIMGRNILGMNSRYR